MDRNAGNPDKVTETAIFQAVAAFKNKNYEKSYTIAGGR
jgi:hypothetical protein